MLERDIKLDKLKTLSNQHPHLTGEELKEFIVEVHRAYYPRMLYGGNILEGLRELGTNVPYPTFNLYLRLLCAEGKLELAKKAGRSKFHRYVEPEIGKLGDLTNIEDPREKLIELHQKGLVRDPEYKRIAEALLKMKKKN